MQFAILAVSVLFTLTAALPSPPRILVGVSDACANQPDGYGPVPGAGSSTGPTPLKFQQYGLFSSNATIATTPTGYQRTFHNHLQSTSGNYYMGLYTLTSYDTAGCSTLCNATTACKGFNIYIERDPSLNPAPSCLNPTPITNYKCTLWGNPPTVVNATNAGQMRMNFVVVIAGSNGYAKLGSVSSTLPDDGTNPYE